MTSEGKIKPRTSHRRNSVVLPEMTLQNSSFNYLIIRIIRVIALTVPFLCITLKPIVVLSCFDVGRSFIPSLNACYLLFHTLLRGTTSFIWPHINKVLRPRLFLHLCQPLNSCKDTPSYQKQTLFSSMQMTSSSSQSLVKHTVVIDLFVTQHPHHLCSQLAAICPQHSPTHTAVEFKMESSKVTQYKD